MVSSDEVLKRSDELSRPSAQLLDHQPNFATISSTFAPVPNFLRNHFISWFRYFEVKTTLPM
jgi:hypothetical protein